MPEKASAHVYDKCTSCAFASEKGPVYGAWPTSHTEVCCLYKFNRQEQSASCLKDLVDQKPNGTCDGLCKDCPSRLKFRQLQIELPVQEPHPGSSDVTQGGISDVPPSCTSVHSGPRKCPKIAPRKRRGFTKLTIEIRPPRFKKKLWFGTWLPEEIDRARDAIKFYMGSNEPFTLSDSPQLFAQHPLGIEYRQLLPSCEEFIQVGQKQVRASVYFARRVKEVIKAVTRGKKKVLPPKKTQKCQVDASRVLHAESDSKIESLQIEASTSQKIYEPIMSCASGSTSPSMLPPCASASTSSSVPCPSGPPFSFSSAEDMVWYGASSEGNSELAPPVHPSVLPPAEMLTYEEEIPIESEIFSSFDWGEEMFPLEEITFSSSAFVAALGEGVCESGMMEDDDLSAFIWS